MGLDRERGLVAIEPGAANRCPRVRGYGGLRDPRVIPDRESGASFPSLWHARRVRPTRGATPGSIEALWHRAYRIAFQFQRLYWWLVRPEIRGAYVAVWLGPDLLVVENSYRRRLSLPAGGIGRGEAPIDAAIRELAEEVQIHVEPEELHFVGEIVSTVGYAEDHAHFYELICEERPDFVVDRHEVVWADFIPPGEALEAGVVDVVRQYLERKSVPESGASKRA